MQMIICHHSTQLNNLPSPKAQTLYTKPVSPLLLSEKQTYKATKAPTAPTTNTALAHCILWLAAFP